MALQNGGEPTNLAGNSESENIQRQLAAAKDFQQLGNIHLAKEQSRVEMVDYYLYKGPSAVELVRNPHAFDSALLPGEGVTEEEELPVENPRPAYCVLALGLQGCPAAVETQPAATSNITREESAVSAIINPNGLATKYSIEYGTTEAYGKTTTATALPDANGKQSVTATLGGLEACTTYYYQAEAENETNEEEGKPGLGGSRTFTTGGCKEKKTWIIDYLFETNGCLAGGEEPLGSTAHFAGPVIKIGDETTGTVWHPYTVYYISNELGETASEINLDGGEWVTDVDYLHWKAKYEGTSGITLETVLHECAGGGSPIVYYFPG